MTKILTDQDFQASGFWPKSNFNRLKLMPTFSLLSVLFQFAQPPSYEIDIDWKILWFGEANAMD